MAATNKKHIHRTVKAGSSRAHWFLVSAHVCVCVCVCVHKHARKHACDISTHRTELCIHMYIMNKHALHREMHTYISYINMHWWHKHIILNMHLWHGQLLAFVAQCVLMTSICSLETYARDTSTDRLSFVIGCILIHTLGIEAQID